MTKGTCVTVDMRMSMGLHISVGLCVTVGRCVNMNLCKCGPAGVCMSLGLVSMGLDE